MGRHYEGVSKSFRTGRLERELQMVQLSATRCSCIAILWDSLVSFAAISLCVAFPRTLLLLSLLSLSTQSANFWIHPRGMDLRETEWEGMGWIRLAHDRDQWRGDVNTEIKLRVSWKARNFSSIYFSRTLPRVVSLHSSLTTEFKKQSGAMRKTLQAARRTKPRNTATLWVLFETNGV
jgi:hypothetical protein